jgi:phospholipid transport system transporter-binding protein
MLVLPSELTHDRATTCSRMLAQAIRSEPSTEVLADVSALERFDSSALAVLLECRREAMVAGKRFVVTGWPPKLRELAGLYGVAELLSPESAAAATA